MELQPAELIALSGCVKDKALTEAKRGLQDGSAHPVDFAVRVRGSVQKGMSTPGTTIEQTPIVNLRTPAAFYAVLRALGIGTRRLQAAVHQVGSSPQADADLEAVFTAEECARAAKLPKSSTSVPGKAGSVQSQVTAEKLLDA